MLFLQYWWAVLVLSLGLGSSLDTKDADHKDDIYKDSKEGSDQLSSFYQAVEQARPELQELRSSFDSLREQYNHFHTLDDMLANFDQPQDAEFKEEELTKEEEEWQESTKAWIRDIQAAQKIPDHVLGLKTKEKESKKQEEKLEESQKDSKLEKDSVSKKESLLEPQAAALEGNVQNKLKNEPKAASTATNMNPEASSKLVAQKDMGARQFPRQSRRAKRSLEENQQEQQQEQQPESQPEQRLVAKRKAQLLDDFEDHNGNRVRFGDLGNGMLIPNAEDLGGKAMSFPGHELLTHYNELETSREDDSLAHIYDPTKNLVPMVNQQANVAPAAQQQLAPQQQKQQQQPQKQANRGGQTSHFKASFNLNHLFNELQKLQSLQPAPAIQQPVQPQPQPVQPAPVQQQIQYQQPQNQYPNRQMVQPARSSGIHRYLGPIFNNQARANFGSQPAMDPNCVPSTPAPVAEPMTPAPAPAPAPAAAPSSGSAIDDACNNADSLKMNVSINANVCGDPKTKQFSGNGSISLQPACSLHGHKVGVDKDERHIREVTDVFNESPSGEWELKGDKKPRWIEGHIKMPAMKWSGKKQANCPPQKMAPKVCGNNTRKCNRLRIKSEDRSNSFDRLISGKLSEDIVDAVFEAVGSDPEMERLLPVLNRNRKCAQRQQKNFYQIRNDKNEKFLHQTESMVRDTMEAISEIIDQQVRRRACIPLRPDLVDFYELILKTADEEQKVREKRQSSLRVLAEDFSEDVRLLDPSKINQKTRVVKKLLNQYQDLPLGDQLAAAEVHDELLLDLDYLRKMSDTAERRQRNARLQEVLKQESLDELLEEHMESEYSPRFIKLLKTAELFKESGEQQAKDLI